MSADADAEDFLVGAEIEAVVFVRDYVQLQLFKPSASFGLTFVSDPVVSRPGQTLKKSNDGWRDALCALIGKTIRTASVESGGLSLDLGGNTLNVPFDGQFGPESARLDVGDRWWVW